MPADITEALPDYVNRLNSIDATADYIEDAISGQATPIYGLLGIRKELRLMDSYDLDPHGEAVAAGHRWQGGRHVRAAAVHPAHVRLMPSRCSIYLRWT